MNTNYDHINDSFIVGYYGFSCRVIDHGAALCYVLISGSYRNIPTMDIVATRAEALAEYARRKPIKRASRQAA